MPHSAEVPDPPAVRFGYFVVQTRAARDGARVDLSGVLEDLGTGEKRAFEGGDALARLMSEWAARGPPAG